MPTRTKQHEKFIEIYNGLNNQQRHAVDTIEGPVMVIAGPGTGKTQILSARIGKILLETDTQPDNILCLTYTDAGAVAMRKRLGGFIGPDAYKVNIYTFHAFCNDIIQENLSLFEKTAMDPLSDLEKIELFKELIDTLPKDHPLKRYRGDVYFEINNLQRLFSDMKREGWKAALIGTKIDEYLADLPTRDEYIYKKSGPGYKKGDLKQKGIDEQTEKMDKLRAAVNEFDRFQALLRTRSRYDFDDMINWVIKAFEDDANLLQRYQERFLYILVDEYQDTSGTQNRLVQLLINYWDKPNIFVVGDDDQSIYRFQGANVENMLTFANSYKNDLLNVVLQNNYRSTQPILDISKTLIDTNTERLVSKIPGLSKDLVSSHPRHQGIGADGNPVIREYDTQRHEMIHLCMEVEALLKSGVQPGQIGIIYKENKYGEELAQYFKLKNIPCYSKRKLNILQLPFGKKIVALLRYLAAEHDIPYGGDEMLFTLLHFDFFNIPAIEVAKLSVDVSNLKFGKQATSLRRLLNERATKPPADLFDKGINEGMKNAGIALENLIAAVPNVTLQTLFEKLIRDGGVLRYVMKSHEKIWLMQVLTALFDFIKDETRRNPMLNLEQLVGTFDLMQREDIALPLVLVSGSEKGINLLTAHGSKGLEYAYVFVVGANANSWERKRKPGGGFSFPDNMFESEPKELVIEELRRLFYVALTRAERYLFVSYSRYDNKGKDLEPSMFIAEIQQQHALPVQQVFVDEENIAFFSALAFEEELQPELAKIEADFIDRILEKFVMNVTALNNYLQCPLNFYFNNLIRVPSGKSEATEFGSSVHFALQRLFEKMQANNNQFYDKAEFVGDFNWYMSRHRESFTREQFARRMEYGDKVLTNYYDKYINTFNKVVAIERNISNVVVKGVPIKGKLDKLEFDGKMVNVVDYKSGDYEKAKAKLKPPNDNDPDGGSYWRQAVFYKILVDNYGQKDWQVISSEFDFIEPDKKKEYQRAKVVIQPQDLTTVTEQIVHVWDKIQQRDFYTGCGKADCHWCKFVKDHNLAIDLHDPNDGEEGEDRNLREVME